ncbi:MAG: class I SAM-dependent methyltransferase [Campylobacteraceae bacterium]|jgi:ubiquinone/menaquinone biosynthesis C-methylase UbiE|nr:class I SAM-dependent methyltransferase [Campylobacteraceae bacterium]
MEEIKVINKHQKDLFEEFEKASVVSFFNMFSDILQKYKNDKRLKIIDIGGGSSYFAIALSDYFADLKCEVVVLDTTEYDTWANYSGKVTFIKGSADDLDKLFEKNSFDLVFANRVFHHFVRDSWRSTVDGMYDIMKQIVALLKDDGRLCMVELFYNGIIFDSASSKLIYAFTSIKLPFIATFFKKLKAKSAGVGVCFLSKKMWLHMFFQSGLAVESFEEDKILKLPWYKRIGLMNKNMSYKNVFVLKR